MRGNSDRRASRGVTLADVARYAGVSSAVVSYVINDGPRRVAPATADRVRSAIDVLGYRPNSQARALSTGSTGILGLVLPETGNPFFGEYNDVIHREAADAGVALLTAGSAGRADTEREVIHDLAGRNVDGIVAVTSMTMGDVPHLRNPGLPILFLNCPFPVPGYRTFGPDAAGGARRLVDHFLDAHGHEGVALVAGETAAHEPEERERGWWDAHRAHGRSAGPLVRTAFTLDGGYAAASALLERPVRPTAIFISSDLQAFGALHAIQDHDLRIPDDIAVASFDGTTMSAHTWPPLTAVRQPLAVMARAAITGILEAAPPQHTLFDTELVLRRSCGCDGTVDSDGQVRGGDGRS